MKARLTFLLFLTVFLFANARIKCDETITVDHLGTDLIFPRDAEQFKNSELIQTLDLRSLNFSLRKEAERFVGEIFSRASAVSSLFTDTAATTASTKLDEAKVQQALLKIKSKYAHQVIRTLSNINSIRFYDKDDVIEKPKNSLGQRGVDLQIEINKWESKQEFNELLVKLSNTTLEDCFARFYLEILKEVVFLQCQLIYDQKGFDSNGQNINILTKSLVLNFIKDVEEELFREFYKSLTNRVEHQGWFTLEEYEDVCRFISFTPINELQKSKLSAKQIQIIENLTDSYSILLFSKALGPLTHEQVFRIFNQLKIDNKPTSTLRLAQIFKKIAKVDLVAQLEQVKKDRFKLYRLQYNRKKGIFSADDPIKVMPRVAKTFEEWKIKATLPKLSDEHHAQLQQVAESCHHSTNSFKQSVLELKQSVVLSDDDIALIERNLSVTPSISAIETTKTKYCRILDNVIRYICSSSGWSHLDIYCKSDLLKRLKAGQPFEVMRLTDDGSSIEGTGFRIDFNRRNFPQQNVRSFPVLFDDVDKSRKKPFVICDLLIQVINEMLETKTKLHYFREVLDDVISNKICQKSKTPWFHYGLSLYVLNKSGNGDVVKLIRDMKAKRKMSPKREKFPRTPEDLEQFEQNSLRVFQKFDEDFGENFIPSLIQEIRKTPVKDVTLLVINQAFEQLTQTKFDTYISKASTN